MKKLIITLFLLCLFLTGCGAADSQVNKTPEGSIDNVVAETTRKIYYKANISISCDDVNEAISIYSTEAGKYNGYMSYSNVSSNQTASITLRVPTENLNEFLGFIQNGYGKVVNINVSSNDITTEYNSTEARLKVLYASEKKYLELLDKSHTMNDIILINTRLEDIQAEILSLEAQMSSYDNLLDYSTININLNIKETSTFFGDYWNYLGNFFVTIGKIILYVLPFLVTGCGICGIAYLLVYLSKKKKTKKEDES